MTFVLSSATVYTGVAKYGHRILEYIEKSGQQGQYILLLNNISGNAIKKIHPNFEYIIIGKRWMKNTLFFKYFFYMYEFKHCVNHMDANLLFSPSGGPICSPKINKSKICVFHDMQVRIDAKLFNRRDAWIYVKSEDRLAKNAKFIFTISEFSKRQILSYYPTIGSKLINMSNSVSMVKTEGIEPMKIGCPYLLYVGRLCQQKNLMTLLKAFNRIKDKYQNYKLVLVSNDGEYWKEIMLPYINEQHIDNRIILTGWCSEEDLSRWYLGASAFVFPSVREGFGSPPLEAAYMEIPVITSKADSLDEVTLGLLNYYEPPMDDEMLASAICKTLENPPSMQRMREIRKEYESHYSIDVIGKRICDFLQKENEKY